MNIETTRRGAGAAIFGLIGAVHAAAAAEALLPIRISGDQPIAWLPFFIAEEKKLWQANGLAPSIIPAATGMVSLISLGGGGADIGPGSEMPLTIAAMNRLSVKIIGSFNQVENMELACKTEIAAPRDLVGKRIAVAQGTPSQYYLSLLAKKYGIAPGSISIVKLGPAEMISALSGGAIDGFVWQEPFLSQAVKLDPKKFHRLPETGLNSIYAVVMASELAIKERRATLVKALQVIDKACALIAAEPKEALQIGAKYSQMDPAIAAEAIGRMKFGLALDVPAMKAKMTEEANWALAEGIAKAGTKVPDYADVLDASLLAEARRA